MKVASIAVVASLILATIAPAHAGASEASTAGSDQLSSASGMLVEGVSTLVMASGELIVDGLTTVGNKTVLVLKHAANGSRVSVQISSETLGAVSLVAGMSVTVITEAAGSLLVAAGKAIAFVPNEVGKSLLFHTRHP
jgi:hypothetical protein